MKNDMEYNMGREFTTLLGEYMQSMPPDEYLQGGGSQTADGKHRKVDWKRWMYMAALVMMAYTAAGAYDSDFHDPDAVQASDAVQTPNVAAIPPEQTNPPISTKEPEASTKSAAGQQTTDSEEQETAGLPYYPMEDVFSNYTVYNDTYDPVNMGYNRIVEEGFLSESLLAQGTEYALPSYEPAEGYEFLGWVIYYDIAAKPPLMTMAGNALTVDNVGYVKPKDGDRSIEVHAAWRSAGIGQYAYLLILDANGGTIESDNSVSYDARGPMGSGTYVYLCAYPVPVREGYTFIGWYTEPDGGDRKTMLMGLDFFPKQGNEYDWSRTISITLYAGWTEE